MDLNKDFWNNRYHQNETGWDVGSITPGLKKYIDQLNDKSFKILIPGAGNSYEAEYLHQKGFTNVFVVDISQIACENLQKRVVDFPSEHIVCDDFFKIGGEFNLILEQTFFCALNPSLRKEYVKKCSELLGSKGKIVGLMFDFPLTSEGPPFGGNIEEYQKLFNPYFQIETMETAHESIESRKNREVFVKLIKR